MFLNFGVRKPDLRSRSDPGRTCSRDIGQRHAGEFDPGILVINRLLGLLVDDARGTHLPERRLFRIVLAGLAGGVDALVEDEGLAIGALGARRWKRVLSGFTTRSRSMKPSRKSSVRLKRSPVMTVPLVSVMRALPVATTRTGAVIDHAVSLDRAALVEDLDVADRGNSVVVLVVDEFARIHDHALLRLGRGRLRRGRLSDGNAAGHRAYRPGSWQARSPQRAASCVSRSNSRHQSKINHRHSMFHPSS